MYVCHRTPHVRNSRVSSLTSNKQKNEGLKITNGEVNEKEQRQLVNTNGLKRHHSSRRRISSRRGRNENGFANSPSNGQDNQNNEHHTIDLNQEEKPA
uniref:Uncharacterized protein n=1 Tax=Meloidogyne enterolobii TaxID=390850 RepID=A0A6V7VLV4_MELEN|nr:unnamed protein product [Meloidogyne enterolobii]